MDFDNRHVEIALGPIYCSGSRVELSATNQAGAAELPMINGYPASNVGRAQRADALLLEAAKQGKTLSYSEASRLVREFETSAGVDPHKPVSFTEAQHQVRSIKVS
jgi:hypothetical protein